MWKGIKGYSVRLPGQGWVGRIRIVGVWFNKFSFGDFRSQMVMLNPVVF